MDFNKPPSEAVIDNTIAALRNNNIEAFFGSDERRRETQSSRAFA